MQLIQETELQVLTDAIYARYGINFSLYESSSFIRRVSRALGRLQFESVYELWASILSKELSIEDFINEITVGLTEMFRNPELWQKLKGDVLPNLEQIDIWHAGCSTGEEVYTMAIVLKEIQKLHNSNILATDINTNFLKEAQKAEIAEDLMAKYNENYQAYTTSSKISLNQYTDPKNKTWVLKKELQQNIEFKTHNLSKHAMNPKFDIIFCRNVMIYFDDILKRQVIELFYNSLKEKGLLIIGYYDALPKNYADFFVTISPKFKIFQKK